MTIPRVIPSIDQLLQRDAVRGLIATYGRTATLAALRAAADDLRARLANAPAAADLKAADATHEVETAAGARLEREFRPSLRSVINATGVVVHTNLGRAPLAASAIAAITAIAPVFTNLEYDLDGGGRGRRDTHAEPRLCTLTGAEAAVVVNNNAAATLLALTALGSGREVVVSRGELVEIGGGFRVPDVLAQSGAAMREVGTTNRTRAADYATAINERTALLLRVHPSNFRIEGFTERPSLASLVAVGRRFGVPVVEDLGSGHLIDRDELPAEPTVRASVDAGVDIICFSGDKLLGGPQAGIIVGREPLVGKIRRHPLMRALRSDKLAYAALDATLLEYAAGRASDTVPVARMIGLTPGEIDRRARAAAAAVSASTIHTEIIDGVSTIGGGSAPGRELPTRLLALRSTTDTPEALEAALRALTPPIVGRIAQDRVVLDLRTVLTEQDEALKAALGRL
ncbi:MAG TPA: L-seryl-tRNA(Sec) selenium transferase [Acidobacteria bacterium]|nr:L-seryl-tRNA(Sec) selenium transferase [Acidobacteriota bacterium]HAK56459.1 L-seryl-tRNA(Sec) selenium transferase [Acidobacteriota bacterium]